MSRPPYKIVMIEPTGPATAATTQIGDEEVLAAARKTVEWAFDRFPGATECRLIDANGTVERIARRRREPLVV